MTADGTLSYVNGRPALRFERRLAHPVDRVWAALTEPDQLAGWYPAELTVQPYVGGTVTERFPDSDIDVPQGTVTAYDPPNLLAFDLIGAHLRWELTPTDDGCLLIFTNIVDTELGAVRFATGWTLCLDALSDVLAGSPVNEPPPERTHELMREYLTAFELADGSISTDSNGWTVRFERWFFPAPEELWAFLLETDDQANPEPVPGGPAPLRFTHGYQPAGKVVRAQKPDLVEYVWTRPTTTVPNTTVPDSTVPDSTEAGVVRFAFAPIDPLDGGGTHLVISQSGPPDLADERFVAAAAWHTHVEGLTSWLAGIEVCWPEGRTEELTAYYRSLSPR